MSGQLRSRSVEDAFRGSVVINVARSNYAIGTRCYFSLKMGRTYYQISVLKDFPIISSMSNYVNGSTSPSISREGRSALTRRNMYISILAALRRARFMRRFFIRDLISTGVRGNLAILQYVTCSNGNARLLVPPTMYMNPNVGTLFLIYYSWVL